MSLFHRAPVAVKPYTATEKTGLLKSRACPLCRRDDANVIQEFEDYQFFSDGRAPRVTLTDVQCRSCCTVYKNPTYTDRGMQELFAQAAASYGSECPADRVLEQVDWLARHHVDTSDILDYGCGDGRFLAALPPGRKIGIDVDKPSIAKGREIHPGITFFDEPLPNLIPFFPKTTTLWHALEHVDDPGGLLKCLHTIKLPYHGASSLASPHGTAHLVVEVPTLERGFTDDVCGFISAQHVTHFSERSLTTLLEWRGWYPTVIERMPYNGYRVLCVNGPMSVPGDHVKSAPEDVALVSRYLTHHAAVCRHVDRRLRGGTEGHPYVMWGAGMHTEALWHETSLREHMPVFIVDNDPGKQETHWRGVEIRPTDFLSPAWWIDWTKTKLVISSYGSQRAIRAAALESGIPESAIVTLYDTPVLY